MKFGVNILNFGRYATPEHLAGWAAFAEERGFHSAMISDHIAVTPDVAAQYPAPFYDPFATLAWLAGQTSRVELGTTVAVLPYRHPLATARTVANIDNFSGGRMILGVGVSWPQQEFAALGVPFGERGAIADEYLEAIIGAWTHDTASFEGRFASYTDVATEPRPVRRPHPPVWVGGASKAAMRRAVRFGQAWHPVYPPLAWLREEGLPALRALADQEGRPVPAFAPRIRLEVAGRPLPDAERRAGEGSIEQIRADLEELAAMGAEHVLFDTYRGAPDLLRPPEEEQRMLAEVADKVVDLEAGTLR